MTFLSLWGLFTLKVLSFFLLAAIFFLFLGGVIAKAKQRVKEGMLILKDLSSNLEQQMQDLWQSTLDKKTAKQKIKAWKKLQKERKHEKLPRLFVLKFDGDIAATDSEKLAEEVTALIQIADKSDEVLLNLESGGGIVHGYGYAASQLLRLKDHGIKLTVAVDKVAASGGYLMAVVADQLLAAPFAIIGSIGVIAQIPNFNRLLKEKGVDFEQVTAGNYKRTLTLFGENTEAGREKLKEQLEGIHIQFKDFIRRQRPEVDVNEIATGDHWLAEEAFRLKLVDALKTSDAYLLDAFMQGRPLFKLEYQSRKSMKQRLMKIALRMLRAG